MRRHIAARGYHPLYEGDCPPEKARPWIDKALADGGWHVYLSHGISTNALKAHLDDIAPLRDRLWIAPYGTVAAYQAAREKAQLKVTAIESGRCTLTLQLPNGAPPVLQKTALTMVIPSTDADPSSKVTTEPADRAVSTEAGENKILVTVFPSQDTVTVRWSKP